MKKTPVQNTTIQKFPEHVKDLATFDADMMSAIIAQLPDNRDVEDFLSRTSDSAGTAPTAILLPETLDQLEEVAAEDVPAFNVLPSVKIARPLEMAKIDVDLPGPAQTVLAQLGADVDMSSATWTHYPLIDVVEHIETCACAGCNMDREEPSEFAEATTGAAAGNLGTLSEMADFLLTGYWNTGYRDGSRSHNVTDSGIDANNGVLHYNISGYGSDTNGVTDARKFLVREAFKLFEATLGIEFIETTSTDSSFVDFFFRDNASGAYASSGYWNSGQWGSTISSAQINVAASWSGGTSTYDDYTFQTILHEIGHAMGLGHQGPYNGSASYGTDSVFDNDNWQSSMMSYFSQTQATAVNASYEFLQTPMVVDWLALDILYGRQGFGVSNAFTEDTVWGFNTNISSDVSDVWATWSAWGNRTASTIVDSGGIDTLDLSGYANNTLINLATSDPGSTAPSSSDIGGRIGNLTIASGTVIENAIGGSGSETFIGNDADNIFVGNGGDDTFVDSAGSDTYNGGAGNDIVQFALGFADYTYSVVGGVLQVVGAAIDWVQDTIEWLAFSDQTLSWQAIVDGTSSNSSPIANADSFAINADDLLSGAGVLGNDTDPDGDALAVASIEGEAILTGGTTVTLASGAQVTMNADGTFDYDQNGAFSTLVIGDTATDSFTYRITDGFSTSAPTTVTISIAGTFENVAPVAVSDSFTVNEDEMLMGAGLLDNDTDADGDLLSVASVEGAAVTAGGTTVTLASGASVTMNADGTFEYNQNGAFDSLNVGETATDSFTYSVSDGASTSASTTVTISIAGTFDNTPAVAVADSFTVNEDDLLSGSGILDNDSDADGDLLSVATIEGATVTSGGTTVTLASGATVTMNPNGTFEYNQNGAFDSLNVGETATDSFTYSVSDGTSRSTPATVTINIAGTFDNSGPVAVNDTYRMSEDGAVTGTVLINDRDIDGDALTVTAVNGSSIAVGTVLTLASGATVTLNADGTFSYDTNGAFTALEDGQIANDGFTYTISDGQGGTDTAEVIMTIDGISPPMDVAAATLTFEVEAPGPYFGSSDLMVSGLDVIATTQLSGSRAGVTGGDGQFSITAINGNFDLNSLDVLSSSGNQKVQFEAYRDGTLVGRVQTSVGARNDKAVTFDSSFDNIDQVVVSGQKALLVDTINVITRTPLDTSGNGTPTAVDDAFSTDETTVVEANLLANDTDPNGDTLTLLTVDGSDTGVATLASGAVVTFRPDGTISYDPNGAFDALIDGQTATDRFAYTLSDADGGVAMATAEVIIAGQGTGPSVTRIDFESAVELLPTTVTQDGFVFSGATLTEAGPGVSSGAFALASLGTSLTVTAANGDSFDFDAAMITLSGNGRDDVLIEGYLDGVLVATGAERLRAGSDTMLAPNDAGFDQIDELVITAGRTFTMDDFSLLG